MTIRSSLMTALLAAAFTSPAAFAQSDCVLSVESAAYVVDVSGSMMQKFSVETSDGSKKDFQKLTAAKDLVARINRAANPEAKLPVSLFTVAPYTAQLALDLHSAKDLQQALDRLNPKLEVFGKGLYEIIGAAIDDKYIAQVKAQVVNQGAIDRMQDQITIVYTPLHGTGNIPARRVMKELGFTHVYVVPQQELPDGDFPTVSYPNPEAKEAFELGLALAKEKNADLVLATDPDADRLGVYVKDTKSGEYIPLTGNMSGSLLCEYVLSQKQANGKIPADAANLLSCP